MIPHRFFFCSFCNSPSGTANGLSEAVIDCGFEVRPSIVSEIVFSSRTAFIAASAMVAGLSSEVSSATFEAFSVKWSSFIDCCSSTVSIISSAAIIFWGSEILVIGLMSAS